MITTKDKIKALAKLNGLKETDNFPKCLAYFLKGVGYDIISENINTTFSTCTNLQSVSFDYDLGGVYILKTSYDNFPVIEIDGREEELKIFIDRVKYNFNEFLQWYAKNFGSRI